MEFVCFTIVIWSHCFAEKLKYCTFCAIIFILGTVHFEHAVAYISLAVDVQ